MAKLDEIAELLTEEIHSFEQTVRKLEILQKSLEDYKLEPDTSLVNQMLHNYHEKQKLRQQILHELVSAIKKSIEKSQMIPGWRIKLFWTFGFLNLLGWGITIILFLKT
ncbi:DUF6730 family protein [Robiginitalea sediminis]|uniref:DUF6730 family protein n=1 Tax=Robiginitalea sediminis TaxID=1982593 RepID=UPI000B4B1402|nr:DUF6730 family protein [Robiginitalea sediminis]